MNNDIFNDDKTPTASELYEQIEYCRREYNNLQQELETTKTELEFTKRRVREVLVDFAFHRAYELAPHDKSEIYFMTLDTIDTDGYHFSYELDDDTKHTICVKHTDLR